ncbi:MAG: hypothetical protein U9M89_02095 [Patescibacteria group bacterium]|nr:hypothetical protein [Patescibacteria group bacterium]
MEEAKNEIISNITGQITEEVAAGFYERIFEVYKTVLDIFPVEYQWIVSTIIFLAIAGFLWNLIKKNWLWLLLLVVLFPTTLLPALKNIFDSLTALFTGTTTS